MSSGMTAAGNLLLNQNKRAGKNDGETHGKAAGDPVQRLEKRGNNRSTDQQDTL